MHFFEILASCIKIRHCRRLTKTCLLSVSETPASLDRATFCDSIVNEYFGKAVAASFVEAFVNNDTKAAVSTSN